MFIKSFILLLAAGLLSAESVSHPVDERIVSGFNALIEKVPWQVSLVITNSKGCGGVIYNKKIVLTAAHCVRGRNPSDIVVSSGSSTRGEGNQIVVKEVITHGNYNPEMNGNYANDIAVLLLRTPIPYGEKAHNITIAKETPVPGQLALITGWGTHHQGDTDLGTVYLRGALVQIEDNARCQTAHSEHITKEMICANGNGNGPCGGDDGGPLVSVPDNKLIGLSSWTPYCGHASIPDVYTNVVELKDWIEITALKALKNELL